MPERINFPANPDNYPSIAEELNSLEDKVLSSLKEGEQPRSISTQIVVVKVANDPDTLSDFLGSYQNSLNQSKTVSRITLGVIDDSTDSVPRDVMENILTQSGLENYYYLRVREQGSESLLGRLRNKIASDESLPIDTRQELLKSLQFLLSERGNITMVDNHPEKTSDDYLKNVYSSLGHGHMSTANIAALIAAYLMGFSGSKMEESLFTHRDDDVFFSTLRFNGNTLSHTNTDSFTERQILFSDPKTKISVSKYAGTSGSPLSILANTVEITEGILSLRRGFIAPNAPTPYVILDRNTGEFKSLTVDEAFENLPLIIESALERTPIAGFKTKESLNLLTVNNLTFIDQGNYTMSGDFARCMPMPTGGLMEYTLPALLKSLYRNNELERVIRLETPPLHFRSPRLQGGDTYTGGLINGAMHPYSIDQRILEQLINEDPELIEKIKVAYWDFGITKEMLLEFMPTLEKRRLRKLEKIKNLRPAIAFRYNDLKDRSKVDRKILESLEKLLNVTSDESMNSINTAIDNRIGSKKRVECVRRNAYAFLDHVKYWSEIFDFAYELGCEDSNLNP